EIICIKEIKEKNIEKIKEKEFIEIQKYLKKDEFNILLWEFGTEYTTSQFYSKINTINKKITFVITGPFGANENLKKLFDLHLSLSKMTFTHEQALYLLIEQIYRLECIKKNIPYTK
ncbi:23S rRNA (pseudouridine(1915)-N(3))-methyltransferase RlmH, partial [bacterium]|nr:23S rRNA (pseudouridine(1915)-N(3))-methyltransferase RlmH [bacterium]